MTDDTYTKTVQIGWTNYQVPEDSVTELCRILLETKDEEFKPLRFSVEEGKSPEREKLLREAKKEAKEETERYSKYWRKECAKTEKLEKRINELEDRLDDTTEGD